MKTLLLIFLVLGLTAAEERKKRQAYQGYGGNYGGEAGYRQAQPQPHQQQAYQQPQQYGGHQQVQQYPPQQAARPPRQHQSAPDEEEKEQGPHPLQLLLEKSKFECGGKSDGYYADSDVGCQAFHYCVTGQKHSMMCPAGTVFHQVHLNCVPSDQDICSKANKFYFVNDYLNKPLEQRGPNNTVQYHQRYYPEGYAVGDPFIPPQEQNQREPPAATYGLGPAYREQSPQPAVAAHRPQPAPYTPPQPQVHAAQQRPAYQQQPARQVAYQPAARPVAYQQPVAYGYGAQQEQAHQAQALQAQRAYAQQQYQAQPPQQQYLYGAGAGQRPRYA